MATLTGTGGEEYTFGAQIELSVSIKQAGVLIDPTSVILIIEEPDGAETTIAEVAGGLTNPAVGDWRYLHTIVKAGTHEYRWKTAGPIGARESWFIALASRVATP